jgi:hypothetical protein
MTILIGVVLILVGLFFLMNAIEEKETLFENPESIIKKINGKKGVLWINLQWSSKDDLDIYVVDPFENEICYLNKEVINHDYQGRRCIGILEKDTNKDIIEENPQENIYWRGVASAGTYTVFVKHHKRNEKNKVNFNLTVIDKFYEYYIFQGKIKEHEKLQVVKFNFSEPGYVRLIEWVKGIYISKL